MSNHRELLNTITHIIKEAKAADAKRVTLSWEQFTSFSTAPVLHHAVTATFRKSHNDGNRNE